MPFKSTISESIFNVYFEASSQVDLLLVMLIPLFFNRVTRYHFVVTIFISLGLPYQSFLMSLFAKVQ